MRDIVAVEVTLEVYEFLDRADHKTENLLHEQRRHWDGRAFDEYIITTEGVGGYGETQEEYLCRMETDVYKRQEQDALEIEIAELEKAVTGYEPSQKSEEKFIALIDKYENFDTLTNTMLNEFVEKILVLINQGYKFLR